MIYAFTPKRLLCYLLVINRGYVFLVNRGYVFPINTVYGHFYLPWFACTPWTIWNLVHRLQSWSTDCHHGKVVQSAEIVLHCHFAQWKMEHMLLITDGTISDFSLSVSRQCKAIPIPGYQNKLHFSISPIELVVTIKWGKTCRKGTRWNVRIYLDLSYLLE